MTYREARRGAVLAGAVLGSLPVAEVALGMGVAGPLHLIVATLGALLVAAGLSGRFL